MPIFDNGLARGHHARPNQRSLYYLKSLPVRRAGVKRALWPSRSGGFPSMGLFWGRAVAIPVPRRSLVAAKGGAKSDHRNGWDAASMHGAMARSRARLLHLLRPRGTEPIRNTLSVLVRPRKVLPPTLLRIA
jgi:hypothetical protein